MRSDQPPRRRRPGRARSSLGTLTILTAGAALIGTGAWFQLRDDGKPAPAHAVDTPRPSAARPSASRPPARTAPTVVPKRPATTSPATKRPARTVKPAPPLRLYLPGQDVTARVVGIRTRGRALIPPANPRVLGWWSDGAKPGSAKGSAVITGHTVHDGGGAFDNLDQLEPGARAVVTTTRGDISYVVESVTTYRKKALARQAAKVFDQAVPGRLVLVTCEDWDGTAYLSNAVVIARPL